MTLGYKAGSVIFAKDFVKVARFYEGLLAMDVVVRDDHVVCLEDAAVQLVIHDIPEDIARGITISDPPALREGGAVKLIFTVDSLDRVRAAAPALGGGLFDPATGFDWGGFRACDGHDPEGNVVQFRELLG